jgi:hypothetical protein
MILEKMSQEKWGWRVLIFKKKTHPLCWCPYYYRLAVRLFRDSYGLQFSVTVK